MDSQFLLDIINATKDMAEQLLTLNTGVILITVTFMEKIFKKDPKRIYFAVPFACFFLSIISSLAILYLLPGLITILDPETVFKSIDIIDPKIVLRSNHPSKFLSLVRFFYHTAPGFFVLGLGSIMIISIVQYRGNRVKGDRSISKEEPEKGQKQG